MSNVTLLHPVRAVSTELVTLLKKLLEEAEAGELTEMVAVFRRADDSVTTCYTPTKDQIRRIAEVSRLLHRLHISCDGSMND